MANTLINGSEVAKRTASSISSITRWWKSGKMPAPLTIGGKKLWRSSDIDLWISLGCPSRKEFDAHKEAQA